jgi:hypothetical protein
MIYYNNKYMETSRAALLSRRSITLTEIDPLLRLAQFCKQCKYTYKFTWDAFKNGTVCTCVLKYKIFTSRTKSYILKTTSKFVPSVDIDNVKRVVSKCVLDEMGLMPDHTGSNIGLRGTSLSNVQDLSEEEEILPVSSDDDDITNGLDTRGLTNTAEKLLSIATNMIRDPNL